MFNTIMVAITVSILADISTVRSTYRLAVNSGSKADELVKTAGSRKSDPLFQAYYATGLALQAKHGWNPATRLANARQAASELNKAVASVPSNLEIRFLRFSFEANAPAVLGITKHTSDDKTWILSHLDKKHAMWDVFKAFLSTCPLLTSAEKEKVTSL